MESVKELKKKILTKLVDDGKDVEDAKAEILAKYDAMAEGNPIFKSNKQIAYNIIAREYDVEVESTLATSGKKAFPLKIGEIVESEKTNFDISGYLVRSPFEITTKDGKPMVFIEVADETGIITVSAYDTNVKGIIGDIGNPKDWEQGDFVSVHNLWWKDKTAHSPSFGQYSSIEKTTPTIEFREIVANPIPSMQDGKYYTIKGIITYIPDGVKKQVYHGMCGHWFAGKGDGDIGELSMCEKCKKPMEVFKSLVVDGLQFADASGVTTVAISPFAEMSDVNVMEEWLFTGKYSQDVFNVTGAKALTEVKKN